MDHLYNRRRQNCTRAALIIKYLTSKTISHGIQRSIATTTTWHGSGPGPGSCVPDIAELRTIRGKSESCFLYSADNPTEFTTLIALRTGSIAGCVRFHDHLCSALNLHGSISTGIAEFPFTRFCDEPTTRTSIHEDFGCDERNKIKTSVKNCESIAIDGKTVEIHDNHR